MNLLSLIALFRKPSVDAALSVFNKALVKLEAAVQHHNAERESHLGKVAEHQDAANAHALEINRAKLLYNRVSAFIEG